MLEQTNCDAVMIGRGVLGNPWLIKQTLDYLETGTYQKEVHHDEVLDVIRTHLDRLLKLKGEKLASLEIRSHIAWYIKGLKGANKVKQLINESKSVEEILDILNHYEENANKFLVQHEADAREFNIEVEIILDKGLPSDKIVHLSKEMEVDLIIMGYYGATGSKAGFGSATERVVRNSHCPVLVVK